jgi:hypothetical protein
MVNADKKFYAKEAKAWTPKTIYKEVLWSIQDINFHDEDYRTDRPGLVMFPVAKLSAKDCQWFADRAHDIEYPMCEETELASLSLALYKRVARRLKIKIDKSYDSDFND